MGEGRFAVKPAVVTLVVAVAVMAVAVGIKLLVEQLTGANAGFVMYIPAVALVAWYRGLLGGIVATLLGALADSLVFVPALVVLQADVVDVQLRVAAYIAGGVAVSYLAHRLRSERDRARTMALLEFSSAYQAWGWIALLVILVSGVVSGIVGGWWTSGQLWLWASLGVFIGVTALMTPIPTAYLNDVRHAVGMATYDDTRKKREPPP